MHMQDSNSMQIQIYVMVPSRKHSRALKNMHKLHMIQIGLIYYDNIGSKVELLR